MSIYCNLCLCQHEAPECKSTDYLDGYRAAVSHQQLFDRLAKAEFNRTLRRKWLSENQLWRCLNGSEKSRKVVQYLIDRGLVIRHHLHPEWMRVEYDD